MKYNQLGTSDLKVSEFCLGTMTYGQQNTLEEAHRQLDVAFDHGINFIDTAEMYPVPPKAETQGATESYLGQWLVKQPRDQLIIATKLIGPSRGMTWIRNGQHRITAATVEQALHDSLQRLQTDYIDLYQIHWPDRYVPLFGQVEFDPSQDRDTIPIADQLAAFGPHLQSGKIRYLGLSNETPWGVLEFCYVAQDLGLPRIVSLQNAYNLLNRVFEYGLAEVCRHEQVGLLAYSPLAFGHLTGKYCQAETDPNARLNQFQTFGHRYRKPNVKAATSGYLEIAKQHGLSPAQLALAYVRSRWFVTSTIIGATSLTQLQENLASLSIQITSDLESEIEAVHTQYPNPAP